MLARHSLSLVHHASIASGFNIHRACYGQQSNQLASKVRAAFSQTKVLKLIGIAILGGGGLIATSQVYDKYQRHKAPVRAFEHANRNIKVANLKRGFIHREDEMRNLVQLIQASADNGQYVVVLGEHGSGKTTIIKQICQNSTVDKEGNSSPRLKGAVYIRFPEVELGRDPAHILASPFMYQASLTTEIINIFSNAVSRIFNWNGSGLDVESKGLSYIMKTYNFTEIFSHVGLSNALLAIERGAREYASHTGQQPILILDDVNHLATKAPEALQIIQSQAKEWADQRVLTVVFVSSDGAQLRGRSSYSRAREYFIGGIPETSAVDYICKHTKLTREIAEHVVHTLTGDRLYLINDMINVPGCSYEEIQDHFFSHMSLRVEQLMDKPLTRVATAKVISALFQSPSKTITRNEFRELVISNSGVPSADWEYIITALSCSDVFLVNTNFVKFQSVGMQTYLEKNPLAVSLTVSSTVRQPWYCL